MATGSEDDYFGTGGSGNHCGCCGMPAGTPHDENCIIHLKVEELPLWREGYADQMKGATKSPLPGPSGLIYMMGVMLAKRQASGARTTKSLEQAIEIASRL